MAVMQNDLIVICLPTHLYSTMAVMLNEMEYWLVNTNTHGSDINYRLVFIQTDGTDA